MFITTSGQIVSIVAVRSRSAYVVRYADGTETTVSPRSLRKVDNRRHW